MQRKQTQTHVREEKREMRLWMIFIRFFLEKRHHASTIYHHHHHHFHREHHFFPCTLCTAFAA